MKKLFSILVVLLSVLCFLGGEKGVLAESNSLETFRGYVNNDGKSSESRLGINNIYIDDNSQTIVGYCFNIKKQYSSIYGDRYTKCTNVNAKRMKENSSSTLEDAKTPVIPEKNSQIPQQLMIQQLCQVILINNQRRNKKRNHSFRQQEIAVV